MTAGTDKDRSLNSLQASHFLWETFKGGEEKDVNRILPFSFLPSFYSPFLTFLCKPFLICQQSHDQVAMTHSSRSAPWAALPLLAVSV